tara:strand:+ start:283 stop:630 length:348 start_codon:yes stop_codon:yes gene_type:complete
MSQIKDETIETKTKIETESESENVLNTDNLNILKKQSNCSKYDNKILLKLLEIHKNDIAECIFDIEDDNVNTRIENYNKPIDWNKKLEDSNFDQQVIRDIFNEKDKLYFKIFNRK